ncbi:phospholipase D-like domain-containing protein [Infirmifilum sp.]|uniref:phospholipase D-like domain-containing protein n=1 Tax=Infirmifilum sp. TaxID=2856575 RepID=UPI003D0C6B99
MLRILRSRPSGCAYLFEIAEELGGRWADALRGLAELEARGLARRSGPPIDPTKPISTTLWCAAEGREEGPYGEVEALILSPPVVSDLGIPQGAPSYGLEESLRSFMCGARESMRIMMPYVGDLLNVLMLSCLEKLRQLKWIRVLTEDEYSNKRVLEPMKSFLSNLEVAYATRKIGGVKVRGVHAKLIVIDSSVAIVGTFNLTNAHLAVDYDVGLVVRGRVVSHLAEVFDAAWRAVSGGS